jgi:alpha-D-ribose 1-methylphosphonate 5-triphosphate diphosphatase PhnM
MQSSFVITNARLVTPEGIRDGSSLRVDDGIISAIDECIPSVAQEIDAQGHYLFPGLIDLH